MNLELIELINKLSEKIKETSIYKEYLLSEKEINDSDEVKILSYKKDIAIMKYGDAIKHFDKNSKEVMEASKVMSEAIYNLNSHELVKIYNIKLAKLNSYLKEIRDQLFGDLLWLKYVVGNTCIEYLSSLL